MSTQNLASSPVITAFLTVSGIDLVISQDSRRVDSTRIAYEHMKGTLNGHAVCVELTEDDELISVEYGDMVLGLRQQPKGHYFSPLRPLPPKAEPADVSFARKAIAKAGMSRARSGKKGDGTPPF
jgi:hypothetical protein